MPNCLYWLDAPLSARPRCQHGHDVCKGCEDTPCLYRVSSPENATWVDPLVILDRNRERTHALRNLLAGRGAFLFCGGPSANDEPLELLARRGCWTLGVNNVAGHPRVRPQAFVCSDPPSKFSSSIWLDPGIIKFIPTPKLTNSYRGTLRKKVNGEFVQLPIKTPDCPNVWGFQRNSWLIPDDRFFRSDGACWGNHQKAVEATGQAKTVCTMLLGIRLLYYLGARTIYLLGVDFRMTPERGYSFGQSRDDSAIASNNALFSTVNDWLVTMQQAQVFSRFGLTLYNTYERSGLRAFPFIPFQEAVQAVCSEVEEVPDLAKWYDPVK